MTLSKAKKNLHNNNLKYKTLAEKLYNECNYLSIQNEKTVLRINKIKKLMRKMEQDFAILKRRLRAYKDSWRSVRRMMAPHPKRKIEQKRGPKPKAKSTVNSNNLNIESNGTDNILPNNATKKTVHRRQQKKTTKLTANG